MNKFYVSLTRDLMGIYLEFTANSQEAVRQYLREEYLRKRQWQIPWLAIHDSVPSEGCIVRAKCGPLYEKVRS